MITVLAGEPTVVPIGEMQLIPEGVVAMAEYVKSVVPGALPEEFDQATDPKVKMAMLFPHHGLREDGTALTDNELLVELGGRKCYDSFGLKAGRKSNKEYIENTQGGVSKSAEDQIEEVIDLFEGYDSAEETPQWLRDRVADWLKEKSQPKIPHASIMYHAKMSFFIAGVSRRVSHELIRHYVGADRDEEGSPSQASTRYIEHPGRYIAHPAIVGNSDEMQHFNLSMAINYSHYIDYVRRRTAKFEIAHGEPPKGLDRKRILESASPYLAHSCETSWIWTCNPISMAKLLMERDNEAADLEFARFAKTWKRMVIKRWPNLFPQPWLKETPDGT